ncbi:hypothetical protein [Parasphingorhabdus sp.]|uniref:hypothetical protein n=1 Tax=Parasphingorhabdus sp. TaxID=2709688 RepID=UPI003BB0B79C
MNILLPMALSTAAAFFNISATGPSKSDTELCIMYHQVQFGKLSTQDAEQADRHSLLVQKWSDHAIANLAMSAEETADIITDALFVTMSEPKWDDGKFLSATGKKCAALEANFQ